MGLDNSNIYTAFQNIMILRILVKTLKRTIRDSISLHRSCCKKYKNTIYSNALKTECMNFKRARILFNAKSFKLY